MKVLLRRMLINAYALFLLTQITTGVRIFGGVSSFLVAGFIFSLLNFIVKPILSVISFPINLITMGLFSIVVNGIILYLLTVLYPQIVISEVVFHGFKFAGFIIPKMTFDAFLAYLAVSVVLSLVTGFISWLFE